MYEASQIIGLVTKIARDPDAAIGKMIDESNTVGGKAAIVAMKQNLCNRYKCKDIKLKIRGVLAVIDMIEVYGDIPKTAQVIVSDLQEIKDFMSIADKRINVVGILRATKIVYNEKEKTVSVTMVLKQEMADRFKSVLGGDMKDE